MSPFIQNLIAIMSAAFGALLTLAISVSHRQLCALISLAAGTLFATTFLHIIPEASRVLPFLSIFLALASGYLVFFAISRFLFHICPACAASHFDEQTARSFKNIAFLLVLALGFHCVMDGIGIVLGEGLEKKADWSIFMAVTVHKLPEGLALCALMIRGGFKKIEAFLTTITIEMLTLLGWGVGELTLKGAAGGPWFYLLLAHVGGGFVYLALHALLNESEEHSPRYILFFFFVGIAVISLTNWFPH